MLLRIDDIVSGISKKSKGGASQPTGPQTEDHENVSLPFALFSSEGLLQAALLFVLLMQILNGAR